MTSNEDTIQAIKDKIPNITPTPPGLHSVATSHELKSRLEWGEPGLTILDIRDSSAFQECRIMGAMNGHWFRWVGSSESLIESGLEGVTNRE